MDGADILSDVKFSPKDIQRACAEVIGTVAPGPDGVPAMLLISCRKELSKNTSFTVKILTVQWQHTSVAASGPNLSYSQGGSRSVAKNYRPVALTSHLIKFFEQVVRKVLVSHIMKLGFLPDGQEVNQHSHSSCLIVYWRVWRQERE